MLVAQAKESAEWFLNEKLPDALIDAAYGKISLQMLNIVLIGMPGCGKSTISRLLGRRLSRDVVDVDEKIEQLAGRTIPQILRDDGEAEFRTLESTALKLLGKQSGIIIATGGGCVTREENYEALLQNGLIVWLKRDLSALPTDGRPLSQSIDIRDLYRIRKPMYAHFTKLIVRNDNSPEQTVQDIINQLE